MLGFEPVYFLWETQKVFPLTQWRLPKPRKEFGFGTTVYPATIISGIDPTLYEAAGSDGWAGGSKRFTLRWRR